MLNGSLAQMWRNLFYGIDFSKFSEAEGISYVEEFTEDKRVPPANSLP